MTSLILCNMRSESVATLSGEHFLACPDCGYDLTGTVAAGRRVCPECGTEIEVHYEKHGAPEWSIAIGLKRAALFLLVRFVLLLPLVVGALYLAEVLPGSRTGFTVVSVLAVGIGVLMAWGYVERAGFTSVLLAGGLVAASVALTIVGAIVLKAFMLQPVGQGFPMHALVAAVGMSAGSLHRMWSEC